VLGEEPARDIVTDVRERSGEPPQELTVGTLNLWGRWAEWPKRLETLRRTYPSPGPDVLMLQEVRHDAFGDQAEEVAAALGYDHCITVEGHRADDGSEGLAMLSRRALVGAHAEPLPASDPARRVLVARVDLTDETVTLVCGHTVAVPEVARRAQVSALLFGRPDDPLALGADLNETPEVLSADIEEAGLRDCLSVDGPPTWPMCKATFGAAWENQLRRAPHFSLRRRRLDYLLCRGMIPVAAEVDELGANGDHASDHALVWARFRVG
jgi:endonuclease/exonuclease/phosphatase family metal-dependent hydrolase